MFSSTCKLTNHQIPFDTNTFLAIIKLSTFVDNYCFTSCMFEDLFKKIGFNSKEATIYTLLYQRGANPVSTLAKLSGIKRTSVYDILKTLLDRGLILNFRQGSTTYFVVDDIKKIYFDQKEKMDYAEKIVQALKSNPANAEGMQINYYKGKEGYSEMHEDALLNAPREIIGWMNMDNFYYGIDPKREEQWTRERYRKGIGARLMLQESPLTLRMKKEDAALNREIRIIPQGHYPFPSSCYIYENHINFFHTENDVFTGVRIKSSAFFELQKQVFEMCWKLLG